MMTAKIESLVHFDEDQVREHLSFIFGKLDFQPGAYVCLRGIGEKGTSQEGTFREEFFFEPAVDINWVNAAVEHCRRWGQHAVASFIVPCVLKAPKATSTNISMFTTVVADFDTGNTDERIAWVAENIGVPDLVVESGGTTEAGTPKRHAWWKIEPTADIEGVINLRHEIAEKAGGDLMLGRGVKSNPFGRSHQPVRIAGTVHGKGDMAKPCRVEWREKITGDCLHTDFADKVKEVEPAPWAVRTKMSLGDGNNVIRGLFGEDSTNAGEDFEPVELNRDVHAGGEIVTRFGEFNRVAGHYIHCIRRGDMDKAEAFEALSGWVSAHMKPAWPETRVRTEWEALCRQDVSSKGAFTEKKSRTEAQAEALPIGENGLLAWSAHRWIVDPVPVHEELVEGLVLKGEPHLFVGEGGSGKTFLVADLALKVASWEKGRDHYWCGQKIRGGGTAVLILCEDSQTEMHIRIKQLDQGGLINQAGDRLIVLPMTNIGGAFPLTERDFKTGGTVTSDKWRRMLDLMKALPEPPVLVAIDTLNSVSHGDENSNVVIAEMMREAHRVCGELGAALLINHHIRKSNEPLRSLEELRSAIRGASAIPSYFRINFGMFHASDYERRMKAMSMTPKRGAMWKFGIVKANIHGLLQGERTLLRNGIGLLEDITAVDSYAAVNVNERVAWMVYAIQQAASALHPYAVGGKNAANGLYKRRNELPPILRGVGWREFGHLVEEALIKGLLVPCAVRGSKSKTYLDVPGGVLSQDEAGVTIASGAYNTAPEWEDYYFDADTAEIVLMARSNAWKAQFGPKSEPLGGSKDKNGQNNAEDMFEDTGTP
jgi:hypothetical protein